jgi:hypothetical protein
MTNPLIVSQNNISSKDKMPVARKAILFTMIIAYSISALLGIIALLSGDVEWRVIATTAIVGTASLVVLCGQTVLHIEKWKYLGIATSLLGLVASGLCLLFVWDLVPYESQLDDDLLKLLMLSSFYAGAGVFSTLLISASHGLTKFPVIASYVTIGLNVLASLLVTIIVAAEDSFSSSMEDLARVLAIVIILSSLSLLITLTVSLLQKISQKGKNEISLPTESTSQPHKITQQSIDSLISHAKWKELDVNVFIENLIVRDIQEYNQKNKQQD